MRENEKDIKKVVSLLDKKVFIKLIKCLLNINYEPLKLIVVIIYVLL